MIDSAGMWTAIRELEQRNARLAQQVQQLQDQRAGRLTAERQIDQRGVVIRLLADQSHEWNGTEWETTWNSKSVSAPASAHDEWFTLIDGSWVNDVAAGGQIKFARRTPGVFDIWMNAKWVVSCGSVSTAFSEDSLASLENYLIINSSEFDTDGNYNSGNEIIHACRTHHRRMYYDGQSHGAVRLIGVDRFRRQLGYFPTFVDPGTNEHWTFFLPSPELEGTAQFGLVGSHAGFIFSVTLDAQITIVETTLDRQTTFDNNTNLFYQLR